MEATVFALQHLPRRCFGPCVRFGCRLSLLPRHGMSRLRMRGGISTTCHRSFKYCLCQVSARLCGPARRVDNRNALDADVPARVPQSDPTRQL